MIGLSYKTIKLTRTPCYSSKRIITRGMHKNFIKKVADAVNKKTGIVTPSSTAVKNHYKIKYDENMQKGQEGVPTSTEKKQQLDNTIPTTGMMKQNPPGLTQGLATLLGYDYTVFLQKTQNKIENKQAIRGHATAVYVRKEEADPSADESLTLDPVTNLYISPPQVKKINHYQLVSTTWEHPTNPNLKLLLGAYTSSPHPWNGIKPIRVDDVLIEGKLTPQYFHPYEPRRLVDITTMVYEHIASYMVLTGLNYATHAKLEESTNIPSGKSAEEIASGSSETNEQQQADEIIK